MLRGRRSCSPGWIVGRSTGWGDRARLADFAAVGVCHHRRYSQHFSHHLPAPNSDPRLACPIFNTVAAQEKEALTLQFFLAGGAHACRPAATNAATVAGPDAVCLSGQRRRAEECGEIRRGVSLGQVSGPRNADREAARSAGECHGRDASAQRSDGPAGAAADRAADQPGLAAACARPGTGG